MKLRRYTVVINTKPYPISLRTRLGYQFRLGYNASYELYANDEITHIKDDENKGFRLVTSEDFE